MKNLMVSFLLILVSLGIMYWSKIEFDISRELVKTGIKTSAEVVDIIEVDDDEGSPTYKSVFEYTDESNTVRRVKNNYSSRPAAHDMGEIVEIVYGSDRKVRVSSFWGLYLTPIMMSFIGFVFGGVALFILKREYGGTEIYYDDF